MYHGLLLISKPKYFNHLLSYKPGWLSGIALGYGLDDWGFESRKGLGILFFTTVSRPALGPNQPPIQWVPGALSLGVQDVKLTTHFNLVPRLRNSGVISPLHPYAFMVWCSVIA
jgi:hypothetical protein